MYQEMQESGDAECDSEEFFFESDHLALKGNKDYRILLQTILTLQVQRMQGIKDIDTIQEIQKDAMENPIGFVEKLNRDESLGIPPEISLQELPQIDWSKYDSVMPKDIDRPFTRTKKTTLINTTCNSPAAWGDDSTSDDGSKVLIRGRAYNDSKPETFNQLWTPEEQKRLEELLVEFPLEEVESRRWKKIADALGNRTPIQVQSRVQKYFKKLQLAGLPIPGRVPRNSLDALRKIHRHQRNNHLLIKPSTFFPAFDPPVHMQDYGDSFSTSHHSAQANTSLETDIAAKQGLFISGANRADALRHIMREKELSSGSHAGYSCDGCGENPLQGTRWHCGECLANNVSFDLCSDCLASVILQDNSHIRIPQYHDACHNFQRIRFSSNISTASSNWDPDYLACATSYNYLDPNFMPD